MPNLDEEDEKFLVEHLYGIWGFDQRIITLEDAGCTGDFSDQGAAELSDVFIVYEDNFVDRRGYKKV